MKKIYKKHQIIGSSGHVGVQSPYNCVSWMRLVYDVWRAVIERKVLVFSLLFLLVTLPIVYLVIKYRTPIEAAWYDDAFAYRQTVAITNAGTAQTDFQVAITLNTSALVTAGKMQSDCDDIRITDVNGKVLPYWFSSCNTTSTKIWPKVPSLPTTGTFVYLYYGNPSATAGKTKVGTQTYPGLSCKSVLDAGNSSGTGNYWIDPTNGNTSDAFQAYCDQTNDSGGWMLVTQSMIQSEANSSTSNVKTTDANSGLINTITLGGTPGCTSKYYQMLLKDTIPWTKIKADYEFYGGNSCWGVFGNATYGLTSNLISYQAGIDTIRNQIKMGGSNGDNFDGITSRCDNETINFWHSNQGYVTRSAQTILRRNSMASYGGIANGVSCTSNTQGWKYQNIYTREDSMEPANITVASPTNEEKSLGPVAYWKFDEGYGANTNDYTSNNNDGTITNAVWKDESLCANGKCLYYDGSGDYVTVADPSNGALDFGSSQNFTVAVWAKIQNPTTYHSFLGKCGQDNTCPGYEFFLNGSTIYFRMTWTGGPQYGTSVSTTYDIRDNNWHYMVAVVDRTNAKVYLYGDGKLLNGSGGSISGVGSVDNSNALTIGTAGAGAWKGFLDDTKIYPYARTAAQIKSDFASKGSGSVKGTAASLGSSAKNNDALSNGLVGYWKMDEAAANTCTGGVNDSCDSSGNGRDASWGGSPTITSGKFSNSVSLPGGTTTEYISLPNTTLTGLSETTIAMWINATTGGNSDAILSGASSAHGDNAFLFYEQTNLAIYVKGSAWSSGVNLADSTWHYLTVTRNATTGLVQVYLDGSLRNSTTTLPTGAVTIDTNGLVLGQEQDSIGGSFDAGQAFNGKYDEVRIYNRALSGKEVRDLYAWAPGPVGYWNMDEKTGTTAYDSSGNGFNSSSFTGSPIWKLGKFGSSLDFTGTNKYISIPTMTGKYSSMLTVSAWVYHTTSANWDDIVAGGCGDILFGFSNNQLNFGGQCNSPFGMLGYTTNINNGWHYVTGTYDSSMARLYVDGVQVNSIARSGSFTPSAIQISRTGEDFQGLIDEVKIYNYARTSGQIIEDMNAGHPLGGSPVGSQVGYWKFDEGADNTCSGGTNDTCNSGNQGSTLDGTLSCGGAGCSGTPDWSNSGKFGKALNFNGTSDIAYVSNSSLLDLTDTVTISAWIKPNNLSSTYTLMGRSWNIMRVITTGSALQIVYAVGGTTENFTTSSVLTAGIWQYIAVTYDRSNIKVYVNGKSVYTEPASGDLGTNDNRLIVGACDCAADPSQYFPGLIDEVKLYSSALTEDEIKLDMNQGAAMVLGSSLQLEDLYGNWVYYQDPARADVLDANNHSILLKSSSWCGHFPATISRTGTYQLYLEYSGTGTLYIDNDGINDNIWNTSLAATSSWQTYTVTKEFTTTGNHLLYFRTSGSNINIRYVKIKDVGPSASTSSYDYCVPGDPTACPAPVAEWKMDEKTGGYAYDTSGNGNVGTITNATWTQGKVGAALNFDGNGDYVNAGTFTSIDGKSAVTGEAWIYPTTVSPTNQEVFVKGTNTLLMRVDSGGVLVVCVNNTTCLSTASGTIVANQWQHIAYSWNTTTDTTYIYVNGRLITSGQETTTTISTGTMYIGSWAGSSEYFNGYIDHVKIYDYARTPAQIAWDYNRGGPVGWWKMDECQGIAANDSSGNGNAGTITIGATGTNTTAGTCTGSTGEAWKDGAIGKYNSSLEFDGTDDYINIGDPSSGILDFGTSDFTLSTWTYRTGTNVDIIVGKRVYPPGYIMYYNADSSITVQVNDTSAHSYSIGTPSCQNTWCSLVAVIKRSTNQLLFYANGKLFSTTDISATTGSVDNAGWLGIGADQSDTTNVFQGQIDDVRIFNYSLTANQVKTLYNQGSSIRFGPATGSP